METSGRELSAHPKGDAVTVEDAGAERCLAVETFGGRVHVEWDPEAAVTPLGQLAFFVEYLKQGGLFDPFAADCPLSYSSPNAPTKRDVLGTIVLSILAGHWRYAHITCLRSDGVSPDLLGMERVVSEESVRRGLKKIDEAAGAAWLQRHLDYVYRPLLQEPWILDVDTTVKPLFGHQEGAVVGYNPHKPGRPSHAYHSYLIAELRLVLDVEVTPGNTTHAKHATPGLYDLLARLERPYWPALLRGDVDWGNEATMSHCEQEGLAYLFKLRTTPKVKRLIAKLTGEGGWMEAGHGFHARETMLRLTGWSRHRRVVVLRRRLQRQAMIVQHDPKQQLLGFAETEPGGELFEYAVLVTSLADEPLTIAQLYRDRGNAENIFDELKNQWGWAGYTTKDLKRCRLMARCQALVYDWWSLFARLIDPDQHTEAITSRPLLLHAVARKTRHANQTRLTVTSSHGDNSDIRRSLARVSTFLADLVRTAGQLSAVEKWCRILSRALIKYLNGRILKPPGKLLPA